MRCTLLLYYPEADADSIGAEAIEEGRRAFAGYAEALEQAGVLISAEVLQSSVRSTTLRIVDGRLRVQDGPFAHSEAPLGGTFVIDVPDQDAAIEWARQAPSLPWGAVEIRPGATHTVAGTWTPGT